MSLPWGKLLLVIELFELQVELRWTRNCSFGKPQLKGFPLSRTFVTLLSCVTTRVSETGGAHTTAKEQFI